MKSPLVRRSFLEISEERCRKLTERAERAETRVNDLSHIGSRARDRETKIVHQLGRLIHHVNRFRRSSGSFKDPTWAALVDEAEAAERLLKG